MGLTLNSGGPLQTAIIRSAYQAIGSGLLVFLITWGASDELKSPLIAAGVAALGALGFRGLFEGSFDQARDSAGDVKPSDVAPK